MLYANPYCETLYGRSPEELEGRASADFSAEPVDASTVDEIGRTLLSGQSWEGDFRVVHKDGTWPSRSTPSTPRSCEVGHGGGRRRVTDFDITRSVETELQLSEREAAHRFLAETGTLLTTSLDFPESFKHLARLSVPFLGDLCVVDVADGLRSRVAAVHADDTRQPLVERLEKEFPPAATGGHPAQAWSAADSPSSRPI